MAWPPDYQKEAHRRLVLFDKVSKDRELLTAMMRFYSENPVNFINDTCVTYDPRNQSPKPKTLPFVLFPKQEQFIDYLNYLIKHQRSGLVEKSRDMGATWAACAFSVWLWIFTNGSSVGWGSRKEMLVDRIGDPDSIFEKMRIIIDYLPAFFVPNKWDNSYMKLVNHDNGSSITGEAGDNIGRGGRKLLYFKDESAHYDRPESIEAALGDNTNVQVDISSVKGTNNVFYRKRSSGIIWNDSKQVIAPDRVAVFILDWRDHPLKTHDWYENRRKKYLNEGLSHIFAQEVDRDYTAALDKVIIPSKWIKSAIDAHIKLGIDDDGERTAGQDVADGGGDKNALAIRNGVILKYAEHWGGEASEAARVAYRTCIEHRVRELYYDAIGVGSGFKNEINHIISNGDGTNKLLVMPWVAGASPINPDDNLNPMDYNSPLNKDFFDNLKAQGWWNLRMRFEKTHKAVTEGMRFPHEELISLPSTLANLHQIEIELSQATFDYTKKGKLIINKLGEGESSPNIADAVVMCYWPTRIVSILDVL